MGVVLADLGMRTVQIYSTDHLKYKFHFKKKPSLVDEVLDLQKKFHF